MKDEHSLLFFYLALKASLFSTGGFGNFPSIHADMLLRDWATERQFAESMMIGQIAPGPNGLWILSLGYLTDGLRGALLALLAITLPPLLILWVDRLYRRIQHHPAVEGFIRGLSLATVGVFTITLTHMLSNLGFDIRTTTILLCAFVLGATRRVPFFAILALSASAGILWR